MLRTLTDQMNSVARAQSVVERRFPNEVALFSSAVTILETSHERPIGWSVRRFFQRRGNVVITDARIFIQSNLLSPMTVFWFVVIGYCLHQYLQRGEILDLVLALVAGGLVIQRRPYSRDVPFNSIERIHFGSVRGIAGRGDIVSIVVHPRVIQLVTAQFVPDQVRERVIALGDARHP
jgi:hypothetical protein